MLKISDYEFLLELYHSKSITQAAHALYISQPALTKRLRQIEQELGTILVNRNVKGVQFTMEGNYVIEYAKKKIADYRELKMALNGITKKNSAALNLASANTIATEVLPDLLRRYQEKFPDIHINLRALGSDDAVQCIYNSIADVGFVCSDQPRSFESVFIRREYMTLISDHPVSICDLPFLPRIDFISNQNSDLLISNWWNNHFDIPPYVSMNVSSVQTCIRLVQRGLGYSILMDRAAYEDLPGIHRQMLYSSSGEPISRNDYMIFLPEAAKKPHVSEFISFCRDCFLRGILEKPCFA